MPFPSDTNPDTELFDLIDAETQRQVTGLQLIASENFTSPAVMRAVGIVLTNKYAEGYPGKRYYGGNAVIDDVESLAIDRVKQLFGADHANVQPHSGANANMCAYQALLELGDTVLGPQPRPRRSPHPRLAGQRQRQAVPLRALQGDARRRAHRHGPGARSGARAPPEDDRRRHHQLPAPARSRAVQGHRRRGRRAVPVRRRAPRRAHRRRRPPQPGAVRRRRHVHHAQDAARPTRWLHPVDGGARRGHRQGGVPRLAGRPARARDRRQGGGVLRGAAAELHGVRAADRAQRQRAGRGARRTRASGSSAAAPTAT